MMKDFKPFLVALLTFPVVVGIIYGAFYFMALKGGLQ